MKSSEVLLILKDVYLEVGLLLEAQMSSLDFLDGQDKINPETVDFMKGYSKALHDVGDILTRANDKLNKILDEED